MKNRYLAEFSVIPEGYEVATNCGKNTCLNPYHLIIQLKGYNMAKKDKKAPAKEAKVKKGKDPVPATKKEKKGKAPEPKPEPKKSKKEPKAPAKEKVSKKGAQASEEWDETEGGGKDFFTLEKGVTKVLVRVRSVISVGQVAFTFNGKKDTKATSGVAVVAECWPYKIDKKKGKIKITSSEPAIVHHVFKALKGNDKAHYTKMMKALECKNPAQLIDNPAGGEVFTSDKGYMYIRGGLTALGIAEMKAVPKLTKKGFAIPNLDCMTTDAMLELNPITQVHEYVLNAVNFPGSAAEKCVAKIRKDKPEFAKLKKKAGDEGKGKGKGKKKKPKKLDEDKEY